MCDVLQPTLEMSPGAYDVSKFSESPPLAWMGPGRRHQQGADTVWNSYVPSEISADCLSGVVQTAAGSLFVHL